MPRPRGRRRRRRRAGVRAAVTLLALIVLTAAAPASPPAGQPEGVGGNVAGAKGLDHALQKLRAPLRDTDPMPAAEQLGRFSPHPGFAVDLVAAEPRVRQPLHLTFDERGRMWVVQYIQYPFPAGVKVVEYDQYIRAKFDKVPPPPPHHVKGSDVVSLFQDGDGDGSFDVQKTFVEGLNIATAALPGRGGVWVLNPPYLLFYPDEDRDDVPDGDPVVHLSGFGLEDTHAVANSLTWGPDGWIYGAQGSTCTAKVKVEAPGPASRASDSTTDFLGQCVWRYHPERHVFEIFAEGGGNTFGVTFDDFGRLFSGTNWGRFRGLHYVQGGYYLKAWGKHGPLTNPYAFGYFEHMSHAGNADRLTHTFEVYGGGLFGAAFDGHIIGPNPIMSRVSVSGLARAGSTFETDDRPTLLTSGDGWFRPVDLKTGPDGALYLADMYEKRISHVDPRDNWHRATGRLWRIRPAGWTPGYEPFDLAGMSSSELLKFLTHENRWYRATARRVLGDRRDASVVPALREKLTTAAGRDAVEGLWALHASGGFDEATAAAAGLGHAEPLVRAWTVRLLTDETGRRLPDEVAARLMELAAREDNAEVRSQLASSAKRMDGAQAVPLIARLVRRASDASDPHVPLLLWWAVESKAVSHRDAVLAAFATPEAWRQPLLRDVILRRLARRYAADASPDNQRALVRLFEAAPGGAERGVLVDGMNEAFAGGATGRLLPELAALVARSGNLEIALRGGDAAAHAKVLDHVRNDDPAVEAQRIRWIELLGQVGRPDAAPALLQAAEQSRSNAVRVAALAALPRFDDAAVGKRVLGIYGRLPLDGGVRAAAVATLASRPAWAELLLKAVRSGAVAKADVAAEQVARIRKHEDATLLALADEVFGPERRPSGADKLRAFERVRQVVLSAPGDPAAGKALFAARCAACHTLHGEGGKLAPDLTGYDRGNTDDMVMNVVDPGAYIREEFQTFGVRTKSGQALVGVITERGATHITIADGAGKSTQIPISDVKSEKALPTSTMPEGLLDGMSDAELRNLFAYLGSNAAEAAAPAAK